jgi:hypothetical protein
MHCGVSGAFHGSDKQEGALLPLSRGRTATTLEQNLTLFMECTMRLGMALILLVSVDADDERQ